MIFESKLNAAGFPLKRSESVTGGEKPKTAVVSPKKGVNLANIAKILAKRRKEKMGAK